MRIAALYDIHGNLPALEAVLADVAHADVDRIVIGGDVFPGPMSCECLALLDALQRPIDFILGNGEREVLVTRRGGPTRVPEHYRSMMRWVAAQIDDADAARIAEWPRVLRVEHPDDGVVLFCHATPRDDDEIFTRETDAERLRPIVDAAAAAVVVCGHTHMQFDRHVGDTRVVNAGSVGAPFGEPAAYWLLLDDGVTLRRTEYDLERAAARIRATTYPLAEEFARQSILAPRSEAEMLAIFRTKEVG